MLTDREIQLLFPGWAKKLGMRFDEAEELCHLKDGLWYPIETCPECVNISGWVNARAGHLRSTGHVAFVLGSDNLRYRSKQWMRNIDKAVKLRVTRKSQEAISYKRLNFSSSSNGLVSGWNGYFWQPGAVMEAKCSMHNHTTPQKDCSCGFYSLWSYVAAANYYGEVVVELNIGGKVFAGLEGAISQYARITRVLKCPESMMSELEDLGYKVEKIQWLEKGDDCGWWNDV
jgi:hypothetical protein